MKSITIGVLLVAVFSLLQETSAGVSDISIEKFKIFSELPETFLKDEQEILENNLYADIVDKSNANDLPEIPLEIKNADLPDIRTDACSINIRHGLAKPTPVFLETDNAAFYPFSETGDMQVAAGKTLQLFCPGKFQSMNTTLVTATCVGGTLFNVEGTTYKFSKLICESWPGYVVKKTGSVCNGGILLKIGFEVSDTRFVEQMQVCFNEEEEVTRYVHHTLQRGSIYYQTGVDRINFQTGGFFDGKNVNQLYTRETQQKTINDDLGGNGRQYFGTSKNAFLARGHMAAKADFVYGTHQRATFLFVNVAPQWQSFNSGNWVRVEDGVRNWVSKNNISVECYTGVYGVTTLPNHKGHETPLYLAQDVNNNGLIPVPKLYFRVVVETLTEKGIVFVGVNNPFLSMEQIERDYIICQDISDKISYINWKRNNIDAGYSYACEVSDFLKAVKTLPNLSAKGGLLI